MLLSHILEVNSFQFLNIVWNQCENRLCRFRVCKCVGKLVNVLLRKIFSLGFFAVYLLMTYLQTQTNSVEIYIRDIIIIVFRFFTFYDIFFSIEDLFFVFKFFWCWIKNWDCNTVWLAEKHMRRQIYDIRLY